MEHIVKNDAFEFVGGHLCLDFANTIGGLRGVVEHEYLASYADLVGWSHQAGILPEDVGLALIRVAGESPDIAQSVLARARDLRETIYVVFSMIAAGGQPQLDQLNVEVVQAMIGAHLISTGDSFDWAWQTASQALDQMIAPIARSAAMLLTSTGMQSIHECAGETCGWLFVDNTKNHRRRWCTTNGCGNRTRVRRHRQRQREDASIS